MSLWCLLSGTAPPRLQPENLDSFTKGLITNDEVIDVNQDPLCLQATRLTRSGDGEVYAKRLEDGAFALGLFNRGNSPAIVRVNWSNLRLSGKMAVRDLWRQRSWACSRRVSSQSSTHGVVMVRIRQVP